MEKLYKIVVEYEEEFFQIAEDEDDAIEQFEEGFTCPIYDEFDIETIEIKSSNDLHKQYDNEIVYDSEGNETTVILFLKKQEAEQERIRKQLEFDNEHLISML